MAASAMLMPPDAEPVMPASELTETAAFTSGFGMPFSASLTTMKPGSARDHAAEAVLGRGVHGRQQRAGDRCLRAAREALATRPKAVSTTSRMPSSSAPSTDQIASTL